MKKILMVCYGGGHVKIIEPLYTELSKKYDITILALTSARSYLEKKGIDFFSFSSFPEFKTAEIRKLGKEALKSLDSTVLEKEESEIYLGRCLNDLAEVYGIDEAWKIYEEKGRSSFLPIGSLRIIIEKINPDLVITTNSPRAERAALYAAKEMNIPTVCIADNIWIDGGIKDVAKNDLATKICVLCNEVKHEIVKRTKFPASKIHVTGTPVFDTLKNLKVTQKAKKSNIKILLADSLLPAKSSRFPLSVGNPDIGPEIRQTLDKLAAEEPFEIIIRPHPNQSIDYTELHNVRFSNPDDNLHELLTQIDIVITAISTVGLEGLIAGTKLISIEDTVFSDAASYERLGLSVGIRKASELLSAVKNIHKHPSKPLELYKGSSVNNIDLLIERLLRKDDA